jgi:hypothetical protein
MATTDTKTLKEILAKFQTATAAMDADALAEEDGVATDETYIPWCVEREAWEDAAVAAAPVMLEEIVRLRALLSEARLYVEAFDCEEGGAGETLCSIKVDVPLEGYPRQYAVRAATASLARIDAELAL